MVTDDKKQTAELANLLQQHATKMGTWSTQYANIGGALVALGWEWTENFPRVLRMFQTT